jgi:hypothetical protein
MPDQNHILVWPRPAPGSRYALCRWAADVIFFPTRRRATTAFTSRRVLCSWVRLALFTEKTWLCRHDGAVGAGLPQQRLARSSARPLACT